YLIEGIRTGAADLDDDGAITVDELHEFASRKVQEESPAMNPQIIVLKQEGYQIRIANVSIGDPKVKYRKEVEAIVLENEGEIDELMDRPYLNELRKSLEIEPETAFAIELEVLEPIWQRNVKMGKYREMFSQAVKRRYPLSERDRQKLQRFQKVLGLRDEDALEMESLIIEAVGSASAVSTVEAENPLSLAENLSTSPVQQPAEDDLQSERGMDYTPLREMLKAGKWKEADKETTRVMCAVMGRQQEGRLSSEDAENFPCADLRTIDRLWVKYSNGKFGFSVQKQIYVETGNPLDGKYYEEKFERFGDRVGWRMKEQWISPSNVTFDISSLKGHLPSRAYRWVLFSRAETCGL
ncbi:MAG TPA: GUN4 domain-containing protein, partial [Leptolyngbya sp.]|nr:GUN4 domain-containing protein [Leptolyngbya sp.]